MGVRKFATFSQLEIWGKAQRESARRPKSDWEKFRGVKFPR